MHTLSRSSFDLSGNFQTVREFVSTCKLSVCPFTPLGTSNWVVLLEEKPTPGKPPSFRTAPFEAPASLPPSDVAAPSTGGSGGRGLLFDPGGRPRALTGLDGSPTCFDG